MHDAKARDGEPEIEFPKALGDAWKGFESYPQGLASAYFQIAAYHGLIDDGNKAMAQVRHSIFGQATWELINHDNIGQCALSLIPNLNVAQLAGRAAGGYATNAALFRKLGKKGRCAGNLSAPIMAGYGSAILAIENKKKRYKCARCIYFR